MTAGAGYWASWVIPSVDAHVSGTLAKTGERTSETSESVTYNFNEPGSCVVFSGVKKASGWYDAKTCNDGGTGVTNKGSGKAHSWNVQAVGAAKCSEIPRAGTAKRAAKAYC